jgi:hypothetical protein
MRVEEPRRVIMLGGGDLGLRGRLAAMALIRGHDKLLGTHRVEIVRAVAGLMI